MSNVSAKSKSFVTLKIGIFIFIIFSITFTRVYETVAQETKPCTWMKSLDDNVLLCNINIPGTHDSGTILRLLLPV